MEGWRNPTSSRPIEVSDFRRKPQLYLVGYKAAYHLTGQNNVQYKARDKPIQYQPIVHLLQGRKDPRQRTRKVIEDLRDPISPFSPFSAIILAFDSHSP